MKTNRLVAYCVFLIVMTTATAMACQVPVFRFALERWAADRYKLTVLHAGPMTDAEKQKIDRLRHADHQSSVSANFAVAVIDVNETGDINKNDDKKMRELWAQNPHAGQPIVVSTYPKNAQEVPDRTIGIKPLSEFSVEQLLDSPARQELVKRMIDGDSAVWIFLTSGNEEEDDAALQVLRQQIARNEMELELPPQEEIEADEFFNAKTKIELRLSFSIVTVDRNDPKESFLVQMLLGSEPDLQSLDEPMAFPVLGRGRVLWALVGKGINESTISSAARFIVGPCSCQVKEQNPGFDLLLATDWNDKVGTEAVLEPSTKASPEPIYLAIPPGK